LPEGGEDFDGVPGLAAPRRPGRPGPLREEATRDGLAVAWDEEEIVSVRLDGEELSSPRASGFLVRDAAADSSYLRFRAGRCAGLDLALAWEARAEADHLDLVARLRSERAADRALTLVFALPVDLGGWAWERDLVGRRPAGGERLADEARIDCGAAGTISRVPSLAFSRGPLGLALAVDPERPLHVRLAWQGASRLLVASFDLGLTEGREAEVALRLFRFDGRGGYRAALERFQDLYPDAVRGRAVHHGLWLPFKSARTIEGWKDFGFRYHEGTDDVAFDRAAGLVALRYSEPLQGWLPLPPGAPREPATALREAARLAEGGSSDAGRALRDAFRDPFGGPRVRFRSEPWCDGAVWTLEPRAPDSGEAGDGEFVDSVEGWAAADVDHDPGRARASRWTPSWDPTSFAPVRFKAQPMFDVLDELCRRPNRPVFINGAPGRFWVLCSRADLFGIERDWMPGGVYTPPPEEELARWRAFAGSRPVHLLLNTDFDKAARADLDRYFQRCLALGFFPSFFSPNASDRSYWDQPALLERDRALFRTYVPLAGRLAAAGWNPVPHVRPGDPSLRVERFGPDSGGRTYWTLHNPGPAPLRTRLAWPDSLLPKRVVEAIRKRPLTLVDGAVDVDLAPRTTWILETER
jgi:hypothetical protein